MVSTCFQGKCGDGFYYFLLFQIVFRVSTFSPIVRDSTLKKSKSRSSLINKLLAYECNFQFKALFTLVTGYSNCHRGLGCVVNNWKILIICNATVTEG